MNGHVIGEFVCDRIVEFKVFEDGAVQYWDFADLNKSCLSYEEIANYIGKGKRGYSWHISKLKIYDQPRGIKGFTRLRSTKFEFELNAIERPPQSWYYVEEVET